MSDENKARLAHDVLDGLSAGRILSRENEQLLRSFLPELPKQMTLEEIYKYVDDAWLEADDPELKEWLHELHAQLKGLKVAAAIAPALPAGMRLADHEVYGRCVVSPGRNHFGQCMIFVLDSDHEEGSDWHYEPSTSLTFLDTSPTERAHPEFLETEADYQNAPEGTIVACDDSPPCHKFGSEWSSVLFWGTKDDRGMSRAIRQVLRWGNE